MMSMYVVDGRSDTSSVQSNCSNAYGTDPGFLSDLISHRIGPCLNYPTYHDN